jgi:hypothetical protein
VNQNLNLSRPNPNFGSVNVVRTIGETWYRALFVEVKRRFAQGFQLNLAYTLAKAENLSGAADGGGTGSESPFSGSSVADSSTSISTAPLRRPTNATASSSTASGICLAAIWKTARPGCYWGASG